MTHRQCYHHITQLTTSTISNYTFYIVLYCTHSSSHQSSYCANNSLNSSARYAQFPKRICTSNLKNSSSNLCCSMNLCRYWCWPLHRVCKPHVQSNLCTFPQGSSSKKETNKVRVFCRSSYCSNQGSICRPLIPPTEKQSN